MRSINGTPKRIVTETFSDIDRVLDVLGVSKRLKGTFFRTLKEVTGRTRRAVLHLAAEVQKQARRSNERDGIERELEAKDREICEFKEEMEKLKNVMATMKDKRKILAAKAENYRKKAENNTTTNKKDVCSRNSQIIAKIA